MPKSDLAEVTSYNPPEEGVQKFTQKPDLTNY